ncbi:MAG TPA: PilW family protein [Rhodocyclaceae bacterium]|nr:PilW family protein [Rhodocyclaceae bacterium]HRQ46441.1 PilW family protein [Rhodocyclaceae bacterium]
MKRNPTRSAAQRGLSLVELLIGMTLGLVVLGGVLYLFAANKQNYRHQESLSRVQESGRFALELLTRDIRMAGYIGCGNLSYVVPATNITTAPIPDLSNDTAITGTATTVSVAMGTPVMAALAEPMTSLDELEIVGNPGFSEDDRLIVTDCAYADIFHVEGISGVASEVLEPAQSLTRQYQNNSQVMNYSEVTYEFDAATNSLRRNNQEVIEGLTAMTFEYGTGVDRSVTAYSAAPADWAEVLAVRINMTIASPDDATVNQTFTTTIGLRNRLP